MDNTLEKIKAGFCAGFNFNHEDWKNGKKELDFSTKKNCFNNTIGKVVRLLLSNPDCDKDVYLNKVNRSIKNKNIQSKPFILLYAEALYMMYKENSRVDIWDALFASPYTEYKTVYKHLLDSYYVCPEYNKEDEDFVNDECYIMQIALYHFWHDTPFVSAINTGAVKHKDFNLTAAIGALCSRYLPL